MNGFYISNQRIRFSGIILSLILLGSTLVISYGISRYGNNMGLTILGGLIGLTIIAGAFFSLEFGFYTSVVLGFSSAILERLLKDAVDFNSFATILIFACFAGLVYRKKYEEDVSIWKGLAHPLNYAFLIYFIYLLLEIFNPYSLSVKGLTFYIVKTLEIFFLYLIALHLFQQKKKIVYFFYFWIIASGLCAAYACYQQWVGLPAFELQWITADPKRTDIYQLDNGSFRKFSTLRDPASFGILMAVSALLSMVVILKAPLKRTKVLFSIAFLFQVLAMSYSGTRTATFALVAGIALYIMLTLDNVKTMMFAVLCTLVLIFLLYAPIHGNVTLNRFRSTFKFSSDASFKVRDNNRAKVQPYIWKHPIGGGPLTTGSNGEKFVPGHTLAGFPTDSGLLRTALEYGWIGLILLCGLYFVILQQGVHRFFRTKDKLIKGLLLAAVIALFGNMVSQYSQVAIGPSPQIFLYYALIAIIVGLSKSDNQKKVNI